MYSLSKVWLCTLLMSKMYKRRVRNAIISRLTLSIKSVFTKIWALKQWIFKRQICQHTITWIWTLAYLSAHCINRYLLLTNRWCTCHHIKLSEEQVFFSTINLIRNTLYLKIILSNVPILFVSVQPVSDMEQAFGANVSCAWLSGHLIVNQRWSIFSLTFFRAKSKMLVSCIPFSLI